VDAGGEAESVRRFGESDVTAAAVKKVREERGEGGREEEVITTQYFRVRWRRREREIELVYNILTIFTY
jgi:hypothetical protein